MSHKKQRKWILLVCIVSALAALATLWMGYVSDFYHTDKTVAEELFDAPAGVSVLASDNCLVYEPEQIQAGLIFYPGAKVEYTAYAPLMKQLSAQGILTVLIKMPQNLAYLGFNMAEDVKTWYPDVKDWYLAGHSMGGAAAAQYASAHAEELKGIIFLASFSVNDLTKSGLPSLSIYGTEDKVLGKDSYEKNKKNLPRNVEIVLNGGNHAYFGAYGEQWGDGTATLSREAQTEKTAAEILKFILE